jgi:hypothetical protein
MAEFGRKLFDFDWDSTYSDDIRRMNDGKIGHPFVSNDALIAWVIILRAVLKTRYLLMLGIVNHFIVSWDWDR